jgi:hypothetical protein
MDVDFAARFEVWGSRFRFLEPIFDIEPGTFILSFSYSSDPSPCSICIKIFPRLKILERFERISFLFQPKLRPTAENFLREFFADRVDLRKINSLEL